MRSKYSYSEISDKDVIINWKDYEAVYSDVAHQILTSLPLKPMKEEKDL